MNDTFSFTLESPLTEEQINLITDAEFEHADRIWFDTPKGKHIEFVKAPQWIPCSERLPKEDGYYLVTNSKWGAPWREITLWMTDGWSSNNEPIAWMPLPKPYEERREAE